MYEGRAVIDAGEGRLHYTPFLGGLENERYVCVCQASVSMCQANVEQRP